MREEPGNEAPVYRLFWDRGSANMAPHAVFREIGRALRERFPAAGIFPAMLCRWTRAMAAPATDYPHLNRLIGLVTARPAWERMMEAEGINWNGPRA